MATIDFRVKNGLVVNEKTQVLSATDATSSTDTGASVYTAGGIAIAKKAFVGTTLSVGSDATITGDLAVNGGNLTTSATTLNLFTGLAATVNFANDGTTISIGKGGAGTTTINNANTVVSGDLAVNGGDLTTNQTTFNLVNATATTVNLGGAATAVEIGAATGTTSVNNNLTVDLNATVTGDVAINGGDLTTTATTFNLVNATATSVNLGGAATAVEIGAATGTTSVNNNLTVDLNATVTGDLAVNGGDITSTATTFNLLNSTVTTGNLFGAGTAVNIGAATGTTNVKNNLQVDLDLDVRGGDITTNQTTFNLINTTATTLNLGGAATTLFIGATTGRTEVNNNLQVDLDLDVRGGDITTNQTTFNLINTTATTVNFAGAATAIEIGAATGTTNINNNLDVDGDVNIDGGDLTVSTTTFNLANTTATTGNLFGAGTSVNIGAATGTTTINNANTVVVGDLAVNGGDLTTSATTFNLLNSTATTVNFAQAGTAISMGATTGTTTVRNNFAVNGNTTLGDASGDTVTINAGSVVLSSALSFGIDDATTNGVAYPLSITHTTTGVPGVGIGSGIQFVSETASGTNRTGGLIDFVTTDITSTSEDFDYVLKLMQNGAAAAERFRVASTGDGTITGDFAVNGGDLTTTQSTGTLFNTTATTVSVGGAATTLNLAHNTASAQTVNLGTGSTGASTYNLATGATAAATTKTVNLGTGGAASSTTNINLGSANGGAVTANSIIRSGVGTGNRGIDFAVNDNYASFRVIHNPTASGGNADGMYVGYQNGNSGSTKLFGGGSGTVSATVNANATNSTSTTTGSLVVSGGLGVANRTSAGAFYSSSGESQVLLKDVSAGTYLGIGIADGTSGWSLGSNCIGLKMDSTTYSAIGMAGSNGILYWARTLTTNGTMNSFLEVDNTRKFYLPTTISSTSTTTGSLVVNGGTGIVGALFTGGGITNSSGSVIRQRYDGSDSYSADHGWNFMQLGNNGDNYILGGKTNVGGNLKFYVNQTNATTGGGAPTLNGTLVLTMASGGTATFGTSSAVQISIDTSDALDFTANSTNDDRGISFNGRAAVTADFNDGYLRLNNSSEFSNGVYIANFLGIAAGANTSYRLTVGSSTDAKMVLSNATNPYIRWQEGTTDKFYIQWNSSLAAPYYDNTASNYHYFNITGSAGGLILRTGGTNRGYVYCNTSNEVGFLDEGGAWAIRHVNDSYTQFRDADEIQFEIGVGATVLGDYGTVTTAGNGKNSWEGYSINGRCVFMHDGANDWGIYDDVNNQWMIYGQGFGTTRYVDLRYNGAVRLTTNAAGVDVSGLLTATTKSFKIDHPTKEGMKLQYACLEGPENGVYVRGKLKNENVIELPDYWLGLVDADSITVSITPRGRKQEIFVGEIKDNKVEIIGDDVDCFYVVYGERKDVDKLKVEINE